MLSENCVLQWEPVQSYVRYGDGIHGITCVLFHMPIGLHVKRFHTSVRFSGRGEAFSLKSIKAQFSVSQRNIHCASCAVCFGG